jgi:hypothetical protein
MRAERKNLIKSRKSLFSLRKAISSEAGNCVNQEGKAPYKREDGRSKKKQIIKYKKEMEGEEKWHF